MLSAPAHMPAIRVASFGTEFAPPDATQDSAMCPFSASTSTSPVRSASVITGNDDPSCINPATGHGHRHGFVSGAAQSAISSPQQPDPARHSHTARPEPQQEKL